MHHFEEQTLGRWELRVRLPDGPPPHPAIFLLHGLAGDELAMGIFGNQIPARYLAVSPRGLFESDLGGYSWLRRTARPWPKAEDFAEPAGQVLALASAVAERFDAGLDQFHLMGFSQGAALVYTLAVEHPARIKSLAGLAGFFPAELDKRVYPGLLAGKNVFISHGTLDQTIPIAQARHAVDVLEKGGARVVYCEAEVGHKLGAACFRALGHFYQTLEP